MSASILFDYPPRIKTFTQGWNDAAERFCSGFWHCPIAGHNVAVDAKLGPEHFPDPMLWTLVRTLSGCATTQAEPKLTLVTDAMHDLGECVTAPDLAMIRWRVSTSAGLANFAALLVDYARRRTLHDVVGRWQDSAIDTYEPIGDVDERVMSDIREWQADGTSLPEPPKLKRPPAIVIRPSIARAPRTTQQYRRRYSSVRVSQ